MAKSKFVKLGEKASIFFDPTSGLKVTSGKAVELSNVHKASKRVVRGLKSGHLDYADSEDQEDLELVYLDSSKNKPVGKVEKNEEEEEDAFNPDQEWDEKSLKKLKVGELEKVAKFFELDYTDQELVDMTKAQLIEAILADEEEDEE